MITLQEQFEKDFPDKSVELINAAGKYKNKIFTNWDLDLREYVNLVDLGLCMNQHIVSVNLTTNHKSLDDLALQENSIVSVNFLNTIPNPEKIKYLKISSNNIQPTDISIFSRFINLRELRIGVTEMDLMEGKRNKFYGSFESWKNLTKLERICIEATDVNEGLEYLPISLVKSIAKEAKKNSRGTGYYFIECGPRGTNAKCATIQNQLRPFNYDLEAWQLAHPEKMLIARPEYFTNPDSKDKWIKALTDKITNSQKELSEVKEKEADKIKKIARLESKIQELTQIKTQISQQTQTEFSTPNKSTQTDLTMEQIKQWERESQQTWYQKIIDKIKKTG